MNEQREKYLTDLMGQVEAYQLLVDNPGWQLLKATIQARADEALKKMRNADSGDMVLKHTYEFLALKDLPEAPSVILQLLKSKLESELNRNNK